MLIIANGAFKSGSTWLFNVAQAITGFESPPEKYLNGKWVNPSLHPDRLATYLKAVDHERVHSIVKQHLETLEQKELVLSNPHVRVLNIERNIEDVVVSAYHHYRNKHSWRGSFEEFYWLHGRGIAGRVKRHHDIWKGAPRTYVASYETWKTAFVPECKRLAEFLEVVLSDEDAEKVRRSTTLEALRDKYKSSEFFRKGESGCGSEYLSDAMKKDVGDICRGKRMGRTRIGRKIERWRARWMLARERGVSLSESGKV